MARGPMAPWPNGRRGCSRAGSFQEKFKLLCDTLHHAHGSPHPLDLADVLAVRVRGLIPRIGKCMCTCGLYSIRVCARARVFVCMRDVRTCTYVSMCVCMTV
jgi:hypothetical protein